MPKTPALWPAFARMAHPLYPKMEKTFVRGEGAYLFDAEGRRYFDGISTLWTNIIGHGRQEIIDAVARQMHQLSFMHLFSGTQHEPAQQLSERLVRLSPFGHSRCFFGLSGSDGTETAIKLARSYWAARGRPEKKTVVGRLSEYHGTSMGALSLMGWDSLQQPYAPLVPRVDRIPPPNCYHCPWGKQPQSCAQECKGAFDEYFERVDAKRNLAAIIIEPIISSDGLITPPAGYWQHVQKLCRENEVLVIADEVSTGMGRTGSLFASSHYGLEPDIVYLAKALTNGYLPLSATLVSEQIHQVIHSSGGYFSHGTTFGGHPAACVAAMGVLDILERERLMERAIQIEALLMAELQAQLGALECVGNINGKGVLFEVELVSDRATRAAPQDEVGLAMRLFAECLEQGQHLRVLGRFICLSPPLISTDDEIRAMVGGLKRAIQKVA